MVAGVITQNVDLLHTKAGSRAVINLHGTYARVVCLDCGHAMSRAALADLLEAANPGSPSAPSRWAASRWHRTPTRWWPAWGVPHRRLPGVRRDAQTGHHLLRRMVAKEVVAQAYSLVDSSDALLVTGSSLTVFSGYRFVRHAAATGKPVAIVNRGPTRGDDLAAVKVDAGCSPILALLADELSGGVPMLP